MKSIATIVTGNTALITTHIRADVKIIEVARIFIKLRTAFKPEITNNTPNVILIKFFVIF